MSKRKNMRLALICVVLLLSVFIGGLSAGLAEVGETQAEEQPFVEIPIYVDGILVGTGIKVGPTTYVPVRSFSESMSRDVEVSWDNELETVTVTMEGLYIEATVGSEVMTANGRYFYLPYGIYKIAGSVYVPIRELAKAFNVPVEWHEDWTISLDTSDMHPILPAEEFYVEEDLYWLSRLIHAESGNQPLDGMIGVGNVVLNRVEDSTCPDTVFDVIFDTEYGVQFSVIESDIIYQEPNEESVIAAKICFEGYNTVGASIFFVNPKTGISSWFMQTRLFVATIGEHDFYE